MPPPAWPTPPVDFLRLALSFVSGFPDDGGVHIRLCRLLRARPTPVSLRDIGVLRLRGRGRAEGPHRARGGADAGGAQGDFPGRVGVRRQPFHPGRQVGSVDLFVFDPLSSCGRQARASLVVF